MVLCKQHATLQYHGRVAVLSIPCLQRPLLRTLGGAVGEAGGQGKHLVALLPLQATCQGPGRCRCSWRQRGTASGGRHTAGACRCGTVVQAGRALQNGQQHQQQAHLGPLARLLHNACHVTAQDLQRRSRGKPAGWAGTIGVWGNSMWPVQLGTRHDAGPKPCRQMRAAADAQAAHEGNDVVA